MPADRPPSTTSAAALGRRLPRRPSRGWASPGWVVQGHHPQRYLGTGPPTAGRDPAGRGGPGPGRVCAGPRLVWCLHGHIFRVLSTRPIHVLVSSSHVFMRRSKSAPVPATTAIAGIATTTIRATDTLSFPEAAAAPAQPSRA